MTDIDGMAQAILDFFQGRFDDWETSDGVWTSKPRPGISQLDLVWVDGEFSPRRLAEAILRETSK